MDRLFNGAPLAALILLLFLGLLVAREAGGWLGNRTRAADGGDTSDQGHILSGALGLLALLIAFTFGLALDRFETRRELVVAEANAIGTAEMRVRLLETPFGARLSDLYVRYAQTRLRYGLATATAKPQIEQESSALRGRIQAETLSALAVIRTTPLAASVIAAVNNSLDVGVAREAAHEARLPATVLLALGVYAFVSAGILGYVFAGGKRPHRALSTLLFVLLALAIGLILDLDRARSGSIRVSQHPMERLVAGFAAATPPVAPASQPSPPSGASPDAGGSSRP